ncbi:uncharacterized protein L201_002393 [Kwoniella dendrophila CBS 6074]|uniref:Uncharacterized protein n=1 Tax=Kwoniella dendrophila CBS 6074 TaxID=1295534 RepID=A0AAX4JRI5_9TREE
MAIAGTLNDTHVHRPVYLSIEPSEEAKSSNVGFYPNMSTHEDGNQNERYVMPWPNDRKKSCLPEGHWEGTYDSAHKEFKITCITEAYNSESKGELTLTENEPEKSLGPYTFTASFNGPNSVQYHNANTANVSLGTLTNN